jgi:hypothetical protein
VVTCTGVCALCQTRSDHRQLDLSSNPFLEKNLQLLAEEVDRMTVHVER